MKITGEKIVYKGKFITVKQVNFTSNDGRDGGIWEAVKRNTYGKIVSIFALTKNREVILEKIFRVPINSYVIELPAGLMDKKDELPEETISRELQEETGYVIKEKPVLLLEGAFNAGLLADQIKIFFARDAERLARPLLENAEDISVITIPIEKLLHFVKNPPADTIIDVKILSVLPILRENGLI